MKLKQVIQGKYACFGLLIYAALATPVYLQAGHGHEHRVDQDSRMSGDSLEHQFWDLVKNQDNDKLADLISPIFLGGNANGAINRNAEIAGLSNLNFDSFSINNVVESQSEDIRIITYNFITTGPNSINDQRVSVWERTKHKHHQYSWQMISHSNSSGNF